MLLEISQAIAQLPEQCRRVMKMSYEQGMSGKEIADAMQITVSTVNNQKARGIILLRKMLSIKGLATLVYLFHNDCRISNSMLELLDNLVSPKFKFGFTRLFCIFMKWYKEILKRSYCKN